MVTLGDLVPLFKFTDAMVLFIHIPKTGGSTIEDYLRGYATRALFSPQTREGVRLLQPCSPQHLHAGPLRYLIGPNFVDWSFAVTRDPLARLVSEYRWRHRRRASAGEPLPDFLAWFERVRGRYAKNPYALDNHLRPQHEFLLEKTEVFRLEDGLDGVVAMLGERLGLGPPKKADGSHRNRSPKLPVEISSAAKREVREFYAVDYERFGY